MNRRVSRRSSAENHSINLNNDETEHLNEYSDIIKNKIDWNLDKSDSDNSDDDNHGKKKSYKNKKQDKSKNCASKNNLNSNKKNTKSNDKRKEIDSDEENQNLERCSSMDSNISFSQTSDLFYQEPKRRKTNNLDDFDNESLDDSDLDNSSLVDDNLISDSESSSTADNNLLPEVGTIESITLINFMCHDHFEITFNPRVNFVIGKNGSGKSAILNAIVIVLGGRASNTGRGQSLIGFIKHGKTSAKIAIKLCNYSTSKRKSYKYSEYGNSIIAERIIKSDGTSSYVLKSAFGKIISRKKEELNEIIQLFSIQIDNPICILSQEVSRNFLNSKSARDKYDFFMKATGLEQLKQAYAISMQQSITAKEILLKKKSFLPSIENEVKNLAKKVDMFTKFNQKKDQLNYLIGELLWSMVYVLEKDEKIPPKQIEDLNRKIEECNERYEEFKEDNLNLEKLKLEFSSNIQTEHDEELKRLQVKKEELSKRIEELSKSKIEKQFKINNLNFNLSTSNKDKQQLEKKILEIKEQISQQEKLIAEQERIKAKRIELKNEQQEIKDKIMELKKEKESKQDEYNKFSDKIKSINYRINKLTSELSSKHNLVGNLKGCGKNSLAKFGTHFQRIVKLIDEEDRKGKFKIKPIGPLGNYIKIKDESISTALESCLKGLMFAFVCDNYQDADYLLKLLRQVNPPQIPLVLRRKFGHRFQIRNEVKLDRYKSFLSYVTIDNDQVFNIIMDKSNLDQTLYIPNDRNAVELLVNENIVPSNLKVAYSSSGTQFYPKKQGSNFRQYSNNRKATGIFTADTNEMIKRLEQEIDDAKEQIKELNTEKQLLNEEQKSYADGLKNFDKEIDACHSKLNNISRELYELSSIKEFKPEDLSIFESELQACLDQIGMFKREIEDLKEEVNELEEKIKIAKTDKKENDLEIVEIKEKFAKILDKLRENEFLIKKNEESMKKIEKRVEEFNLRKENAMQQLTEITLKKEEAIVKAKEKYEDKIETNRSPNTIEKEVNDLNKFLQENENRLGDREEIFASYKEKLTHFEKMKDQVEFLETYINEFTESIRKRGEIYCKLRNRISSDACKNFTTHLQLLNFTGSLQIFHRDTQIGNKLKRGRTLEFQINPKSSDPNLMYKDTRSLSGGERSYSTIAFLLALWESAYSPFNVLDEVDVFMDMVTRHTALDRIIDSANKKQGKQFIFLSPLPPEKQDINNLLKIYYMPDPNRVHDEPNGVQDN